MTDWLPFPDLASKRLCDQRPEPFSFPSDEPKVTAISDCDLVFALQTEVTQHQKNRKEDWPEKR